VTTNSSSSSSSSRKKRRQWLELKVTELSYRGHSYREISDKLQVSLFTISKILHKLNLQAKEEIKGWIDYKTPWEYQKSLMLLEYMQKKVIEIGETTKDERVQLEAMARLADIDAQKRQLLSDTFVINSAIASLQKQRKYEIILQQQQKKKIKPRQQEVNPPEKPKQQMQMQMKDSSDTDNKKTDCSGGVSTHEPEPEESNG